MCLGVRHVSADRVRRMRAAQTNFADRVSAAIRHLRTWRLLSERIRQHVASRSYAMERRDVKLVRGAWKLLVGIKDGLVLIAMLLFFGLLFAALNRAAEHDGDQGRRAAARPRRHDRRAARGADAVRRAVGRRSRTQQYRLRDVVRAIDTARTDDARQGGRARSRQLRRRLSGGARRGRRGARRGCARAASRCSPMPPPIPTAAIGSPPMRARSGSIRWAARCSPGRAERSSITRA